MTQPAQPAVFLSHTWADKPLVRRLSADLEAAGARVWLDEAEVKIGDSLIEKIREGIDRVDYLAVVLTSRSVNSEWVKREVDIAMTQEIRGKRIKVLPLVFERCELPGFLEGKLYADFTDPQDYPRAFSQLLARLNLPPLTSDVILTQLRQISGIWIGGWDHKGMRRDAILSINAASATPEVEMRISYQKNGVLTLVVQQLRPRTDGTMWTFEGIGYQFVARGTARGWHLDTFELTFDAEQGALVGAKRDTRRRTAPVRFTREHVVYLDIGGGTISTAVAVVKHDFVGRVDVDALTADFRRVAERHAKHAVPRDKELTSNELQTAYRDPWTPTDERAFPRLSHASILKLHSVAVELSLQDSRTALLAGLDVAVTSTLPVMLDPNSQLLSDLHHLNSFRPIGEFNPLELWLANAIALRRSNRETATIQAQLEALRRGGNADGA